MARPSGSEKRLIYPSKHRRRERQKRNNIPPDRESSEGKSLYAPKNKTKNKEAEKNHAESSSEGGSSGYLAAAEEWRRKCGISGRGLGHASRC
jgi:hypothetical protein